jgi:hypothetical protein
MAKIRTFAWSGAHLKKHLERLVRACVPDDGAVLLGVALRQERGVGPLPGPFQAAGKASRWPGSRGARGTIWIARRSDCSSVAQALDLARHHGAEDPFFWLPSRDGKQFARLATSDHDGTAWTTLPEDEDHREGALLAEGFSLDRPEAPAWLEVNAAWRLG